MTDEMPIPELAERAKTVNLPKSKKSTVRQRSSSADDVEKAEKRAIAAEKRAAAAEKKVIAAQKKVVAAEKRAKAAEKRAEAAEKKAKAAKTRKTASSTKTPRKRKPSSQGSGAADLLGKLADGISTDDVVDLIAAQLKKDK